jgi:hypothetical protein
MTREIYLGKAKALQDLGNQRTQPTWLEQSHSLPFNLLSDDEFEILCYLLLLRENPKDQIFYYGKTGDAGRDIVWVRSDNSIELIQCKRFQKNIGISEVKSEIAKIFVNCHRNIIPEKPHLINFYVSSGFTAPALNIIQYPDGWSKSSELAFEKHLKTKPDKSLLDFASGWKPSFSHEIGLDITERLKKHTDLMDEFFRVRKVTDNTEIQKFNRNIDTHLSKQDSAIQHMTQLIEKMATGNMPVTFQSDDPFFPIKELIRKAEENAPGVCFKFLEIDSSGAVRFLVFAKPGHGEKPLCNLIFPDTELGAQGSEKFRSFIEQGYDITLRKGEFILEYLFPLPPQFLYHHESERRVINLRHNSSSHKMPVRLEVLGDNEEIVERLELSYLQFTRAGTEELEVVIEGEHFVGKAIGIISRKHNFQSYFTFHGGSDDLKSVKASFAKATIALILNIFHNKKVRVVLLEDPDVSVDLGGAGINNQPNIPEDFLKASYRFLENLIKINRKFGIDLRHPGHLKAEDIHQAEMIVAVIEGLTISYGYGKYSYPVKRHHLIQLIDFLKQMESREISDFPTLTYEDELSPEILGYKTPKVECTTEYNGVHFVKNIAELEQVYSSVSDEEPIEIEFEYESAIRKFGSW